MNCLAIDDEPLALDIIDDYVTRIPLLTSLGSFTSALEAVELINKEKVDLIFLDIHMPNLSGIEFIQSMQNMPMVIFTTAYNQYALKGYELNVLDYLLKPISFERFLAAVNKAQEQFQLRKKLSQLSPDKQQKYIFVKAEYDTLRIDVNSILYIEGLGDYIKVYTPGKTHVVHSSMKKILEILPQNDFLRVHKSFIIGMKHLHSFNKNKLVIGKKTIQIGDSYKANFQKRIDQESL